MNAHYKSIVLGLARTLHELRQHRDVNYKVTTQLVFWHMVENLMEQLKVANPKFDHKEFTDEILEYAILPSVDPEPLLNLFDEHLDHDNNLRALGIIPPSEYYRGER